MANKFHNDIGYEQNTECIWIYSGDTVDKLNISNRWYQKGVNFSFISPPQKIKGLEAVAQPGAGSKGWQGNAEFNSKNIISCDEDNDLIYSPRTYLISPYLAIASRHYRPHYHQCGEGKDGVEDTIRFHHEDGFYDARVEAYRLISSSGLGGGCEYYNPGACGVPSGISDLSSDNNQILLACNQDRVLIKFKDPVPSYVRPTKLVTERFLKKYMDEFENPKTAQSNRILVLIDPVSYTHLTLPTIYSV